MWTYELGLRLGLVKAAVGPFDAMGGSSNQFRRPSVPGGMGGLGGPSRYRPPASLSDSGHRARAQQQAAAVPQRAQQMAGRQFGSSTATYNPATGGYGLRRTQPTQPPATPTPVAAPPAPEPIQAPQPPTGVASGMGQLTPPRAVKAPPPTTAKATAPQVTAPPAPAMARTQPPTGNSLASAPPAPPAPSPTAPPAPNQGMASLGQTVGESTQQRPPASKGQWWGVPTAANPGAGRTLSKPTPTRQMPPGGDMGGSTAQYRSEIPDPSAPAMSAEEYQRLLAQPSPPQNAGMLDMLQSGARAESADMESGNWAATHPAQDSAMSAAQLASYFIPGPQRLARIPLIGRAMRPLFGVGAGEGVGKARGEIGDLLNWFGNLGQEQSAPQHNHRPYEQMPEATGSQQYPWLPMANGDWAQQAREAWGQEKGGSALENLVNTFELGQKAADWLDSSADFVRNTLGQGGPMGPPSGEVSPPTASQQHMDLYSQPNSPGMNASRIAQQRGVPDAQSDEIQRQLQELHSRDVPYGMLDQLGTSLAQSAPTSHPLNVNRAPATGGAAKSTPQPPSPYGGAAGLGSGAGGGGIGEMAGKLWNNPYVKYPALVGGGALAAYGLGQMLGGRQEEEQRPQPQYQPQMPPMMMPQMLQGPNMGQGRLAVFGY